MVYKGDIMFKTMPLSIPDTATKAITLLANPYCPKGFIGFIM